MKFSEMIATGDTLVEFYRRDCPACKLMAPVVAEVAREQGVKLVMADGDANAELGRRLNLEYVPTLVLFKEGRERGRLTGRQPAAVVSEFVRQAIA